MIMKYAGLMLANALRPKGSYIRHVNFSGKRPTVNQFTALAA
jgi:hypothetical protein